MGKFLSIDDKEQDLLYTALDEMLIEMKKSKREEDKLLLEIGEKLLERMCF